MDMRFRKPYKQTLFYQVRQVGKRVHLLKKELKKAISNSFLAVKIIDRFDDCFKRWRKDKED